MHIQYKYVVRNKDGSVVRWQEGANVSLDLPGGNAAELALDVEDSWNKSKQVGLSPCRLLQALRCSAAVKASAHAPPLPTCMHPACILTLACVFACLCKTRLLTHLTAAAAGGCSSFCLATNPCNTLGTHQGLNHPPLLPVSAGQAHPCHRHTSSLQHPRAHRVWAAAGAGGQLCSPGRLECGQCPAAQLAGGAHLGDTCGAACWVSALVGSLALAIAVVCCLCAVWVSAGGVGSISSFEVCGTECVLALMLFTWQESERAAVCVC